MTESNEIIVTQPNALVLAGEIANRAAAENVFEDYRQRRAAQTLRHQDADLALFARFLAQTGIVVGDLTADPVAWYGITWGIVAAFVRWQLQEGYAVGSVNVRLATIKAYCALAHHTGDSSTLDAAGTVSSSAKNETRADQIPILIDGDDGDHRTFAF